MCGICGALELDGGDPIDAVLLRRMVAALRHRGPDDNGGYRDRHIALGQARLAIIDLAGGAQPMANETGDIWVVFNGEIYNYVELSEELADLGHHFSTRSDTETILHAYEQWGPRCVERLNGQFAFALWDRPRRRLVLARDRLGIRPLYYAQVGGRLYFASEMKAILQDRTVPRQIDLAGLAQVFTFWAPVAPRTALAGISQLEPGCLLVVENGALQKQRYWQPQFARSSSGTSYADEATLDRLADELRDRLERSTRLRMLRADVPVGVYLSGGIDSSLIGALVRRFHHGTLQTFSLRFTDPQFDEGRYQRQMHERLGTQHSEVEIGYDAIAASFPEVVRQTETPLLRAAPAPLLLLSRLVRERGYKVVLTGEGADEFLGGYDIFRENKVRRFCARMPESTLRPRLLERLYPWLARSPARTRALQQAFFAKGFDQLDQPHFSHIPRWQSTAALQRFFTADVQQRLREVDPVDALLQQLPPAIGEWDPLGKAQYLEVITLLSGYLLSSQGDRMLMGNSIEGRFPFLDPDVIEFANALPPEAKLRVLDEKHLLKRAASDLLPPTIVHRVKQPYRAPDAQSFVQDGAPDYVHELLSEGTIKRVGLFSTGAVGRLMTKMRHGRAHTPSNSDNMAVLGVLSTQLLYRLFVEGADLIIDDPPDLRRWHDACERVDR